MTETTAELDGQIDIYEAIGDSEPDAAVQETPHDLDPR